MNTNSTDTVFGFITSDPCMENASKCTKNIATTMDADTSHHQQESHMCAPCSNNSYTLMKNTSLFEPDEADDLDLPSLSETCEGDTSCAESFSSSGTSSVRSQDGNTRLKQSNTVLNTFEDESPATPPTLTKGNVCDGMFCLSNLFSWSYGDNSNKLLVPVEKDFRPIQAIPEDSNLDVSVLDGTPEAVMDDQVDDIRNDIQTSILAIIGCTGSSDDSWEKAIDHLMCKTCIKGSDQENEYTHFAPTSPRLRNRNSYQRDKAVKRIQTLRRSGLGKEFSLVHVSNLLDNDMQRNRPRMISPSRSFDCMGDSNNKRGLTLKKTVEKPSYFHSLMFNQTFASIPSVDSEDNEVELYYDSDPGCSSRHDLRHQTEHMDLSSPLGDKNGCLKATRAVSCPVSKSKTSKRSKVLPSLNMETFQINDVRMVSDLMHDMILNEIPCILHSTATKTYKHPIMIKAWFEMGSCLKATLVQPKFVWRSVTSEFSSRKDMINAIQRPDGIELLDIVRILKLHQGSNRLSHSFVKLSHSFSILTNTGEEYLFELASEEERNKFVFSFKLLIARLASKIIVGDKDVFEEFFSPQGRKNRIETDENRSTLTPSGSTHSFSTTLVAPVQRESSRQDELWGVSPCEDSQK